MKKTKSPCSKDLVTIPLSFLLFVHLFGCCGLGCSVRDPPFVAARSLSGLAAVALVAARSLSGLAAVALVAACGILLLLRRAVSLDVAQGLSSWGARA